MADSFSPTQKLRHQEHSVLDSILFVTRRPVGVVHPEKRLFHDVENSTLQVVRRVHQGVSELRNYFFRVKLRQSLIAFGLQFCIKSRQLSLCMCFETILLILVPMIYDRRVDRPRKGKAARTKRHPKLRVIRH